MSSRGYVAFGCLVLATALGCAGGEPDAQPVADDAEVDIAFGPERADLDVCSTERVIVEPTPVQPGERTEAEVRSTSENVDRVIHGDVTVGTSAFSEPITEAEVLLDGSNVPILQRSAYVLVQEDVEIPVPAGPGRMADEGRRAAGARSDEDPVPHVLTSAAWVVDARDGTQLFGWGCSSERR